MSNSIVVAENLCKQYASQKADYAIQGLNLDIPQGCLFGLIGPDGAGKSTTLRILATIIEPTSGHAGICGHDVS